MKVTASQIRQDLNCFGGFGQQGYGYNVTELRKEIGLILGVDKERPLIIIGAGNIGHALAVHLDYARFGCRLCGIFDVNETITGSDIGQFRVLPMSELDKFCTEKKPEVAVHCIPKAAAPEICEKLVKLGVKGFWNFSHSDITAGNQSDIVAENVHLGDSLMALCYGLNEHEKQNDSDE